MTVIITGARAPVALDLARACRTAGYTVHLVDSAPSFAARALRPAFPVHRLPSPRHDFAAFRAAMVKLIATVGAKHIIPTCEEVFWLAEAARRDGYSDRLFAPGIDLLATLHSKALFPAFAASLGIAVPKTEILDSVIDAAAMTLDQLVFKPEFSRFATHTRIAPNASDCVRIRPGPSHRWVAQQRLFGEEICTWAAVHKGKVTAFSAYRPRWRHGQAAAYMIDAINAPAARAISEAIGTATAMTGHLSFDIIVTDDGTTYPIECNPRAVSGLHLFDASADMARAVVAGIRCADPPASTRRHMGPAMALLGVPSAMMRGRLTDLRDDWRQSRDVIDREDNPRVAIACLADAAVFALHGLRAARSPASASTGDIEWDGEAMV